MATRETESGGSSGSSSGFCGSLGADSLDDPSAASTESIGFQQCYSTGESLIEPSRISQSSFDPIKQHLELELDRIATKIRGYSLERVLVESALSHPENQQGGPEAAAESGGDISIVLVERLRNLEDHLTGLRAHARVIHYLLHLRSESESRRSPYSLHDSLEELPTEETDSLDVTMTIDDSRLLGNSNPPISEKADDIKSAETPTLADMRPIVQGNAQRGKNYKTAEKERTFISPRKVCSQACASCCPILKGITEQEKSKDSSALAPLSGANQRLLKQRNAPAIGPLKTADGQSDHTPSVVAVVNPTTHQPPLPESDKKATDTEVNQNPLKNRLKRKSTYKVTQQHRQEKQNLLNEALVKLQIKLDDAEQKIKVLEEELKKATEPKSMKIIAPPKDNVNEKIRDKLEKECKTLKESLQEYTRKLEQANTKISELIKEKAELLHKLQVTETVATKQRDAAESEIQAMLSEKIMMMSKMSEMEGAFLKLKDRVSNAEMQATEERGLRLGLQSKLEEMKGRVRVYCRIRPIEIMDNGQPEPLAVEVGPNRYTAFVHLDANSSSSSSLNGRRDGNALKEFNFDRVFPPEATQEEVFQEARDLIECALDGYNVCICAYGQTGSGKTHTILGGGTEETCGLAPRTFSLLFELSSGGSSGGNSLRPAITRDLTVSVSILELYNERLIDLLRIDGTGEKAEQLEICRSGGEIGGEVWVRGAKRVNVSDANCLCSLVQQAVAHRRTASTGMNAVSSRSHLLISLNIQATCSVTGSVSRGKISLLDLAGSERASRTGATDDRLREAGAINKSLSALGDVIYALATGQSFIPYRNSKLTMLMQDCLGGNAKTLMFVNVSPSASRVDETLTSLVYASRVKHITNTARKTADTKEIARLKKVIKKLQGRNDRSDIESDLEVS